MANEILIVDDEDRIRRLLKLYLERESFEIHEASNGKEAYELAMENNVHSFRFNASRNGWYRSCF